MNTLIDFTWVESNAQLAEICKKVALANVIALDTEFVRIRTYYPKLGLLQLFDGKQVYLIDPLTISDFSPFISLLKNPHILKVLHACGEDLEVFLHTFNQMPAPMIDTQIMSNFIGLGLSVGFSKLVANYCQIELDKSASRTDWLARPLSEKQCQYAASDVWFLLPVFKKLQIELAKTRWQHAVEQECQALIDKRLVEQNPNQAYKKIGNAWQLNTQQLAVLQHLEKWRLEEAKKRNLALNFVVKEQALWQLAKIQPKHTAEMLAFMHPNEVRLHGKKLLLLIVQAKTILPENRPNPIQRIIDFPHYKRDMSFLKKALAESQPKDLSQEVFCSKRQLEQLFKWQSQGQPQDRLPELLCNWRAEFGQKLWQHYQRFLEKNEVICPLEMN